MGRETNKKFYARTGVITLCGWLAALLSLILGDEPTKLVIPLLFLLYVIPMAIYFGKGTAIIGSCFACLAFAALLFPPQYSFRVESSTDRLALVFFQLCAVAIACLSDTQLAR